MPHSRHWQQTGDRRGWRIHENLLYQARLRVLQGWRPPSVQWPTSPVVITLDWEFEASFATEVVHTVNTTHSSVIGCSLEGVQARTVHCSIGPIRHSRIEISAGGDFKGTSPVDSPTKCPAGRRLPLVLHQSYPTSRESSGRSGGRPGGSCQVRGGTSGRVAEVGGAQSSCDCPDHSSSQCGSIHSTIRSRGRGEFVAGHSRRVDPGAGQFARTCSATTSSSPRTQSDGVGCGAH